MSQFTSTLQRLSLIALIPLAVTGCNFNPATDHVHAPIRPENVFDDNLWWIPLKLAGNDDEWFYVPQTAAALSDNAQYQPGLSIDVLVHGQVWRATKEANGAISYEGPLDPPDVPPSASMVLACILLIAFGIAGVVSFVSVKGVLSETKDVAEATKAKERELAAERRRQSDILKGNRDDQHRADQAQAAAAEVLRIEREEFEQQKNTYIAAVRESKLDRTPPAHEEWKTLSEAVRAHQFRGRGTGPGLVVDYYLDPNTSGAFVFMWNITWDRPYPPTIVVCRDGSEIRRETGMFNGEFGSQLFKRNHRYKFKFTLVDGTKNLPHPLLIELALPPFDAWTPEAPRPMTDEERREKREARRRELYRHAEQFITDPQKLKNKKAAIDREIIEEFGEE